MAHFCLPAGQLSYSSGEHDKRGAFVSVRLPFLPGHVQKNPGEADGLSGISVEKGAAFRLSFRQDMRGKTVAGEKVIDALHRI